MAYEPEGLVVRIKRSTRDQEGEGRFVPVPRLPRRDPCSVRAVQAWVELSGKASGPLFTRLDRAGDGQRITGKAVANLRKKLGMSKTQFARLLGLSVGTVGNWERTKGRLNLRARTLSAWNGVERLTQKAAWKRLERQ